MCNKSLAKRPCDPLASCGISVRFQTLSHTQRQVAHALLTRPPLTQGPKPPCPFDLNVLCTPPAFILSQDQTLEIIVLKQPRSPSVDPILLSSLALSFFYFCLSSILILRISEIRFKLFSLCTSLLLFNFQRSFRPRNAFRAATFLFYHFCPALSSTFLKFFKVFSKWAWVVASLVG